MQQSQPEPNPSSPSGPKRWGNGGTREIIVSNLLAIAISMILGWKLSGLMAVFCCQSIIIGYFWYHRINALQAFSTAGFKINNRAVEPTPQTKRHTAFFFVVHFGLFHLIYVMTLASQGAFSNAGWFWLLLIAASFVHSHYVSFKQNIAADSQGKPNIGTMMFLPYARIIPMHLMIGAGAIAAGDIENRLLLLAFGLLKLGADVLMHVLEHKVLRTN